MMENINSYELKTKLKKELIDYYDQIKYDIDIRAQILMINSEKNQVQLHDKHSSILRINLEMIECVENIANSNMDLLKHYFSEYKQTNLDIDDLKFQILENHCFYIKEFELNNQLREKCIIGILVKADWYFNKTEIDYIR
jgi:hypothetical protein